MFSVSRRAGVAASTSVPPVDDDIGGSGLGAPSMRTAPRSVRTVRQVAAVIAGVFASFQVYTSIFGPLPGISHRAVHVGFALVCVFLAVSVMEGARWVRLRLLSGILASIAATMTIGYVVVNYESAVGDPRFGYEPMQVLLAAVLVALLLLAAYQTVGLVVPVLVLLGLAYPFVSERLPGPWAAPSLRVDTVARHLYFTAEGIFGTITGVSAREVAAFIILGSFLMATGAGQFFLGLAKFIGGHARGGSAQVALLASTFFGMINGSATANAASTGTMTIPLMKRQGYPPAFAAAVEAVASTGGQITPPVMGATAFVMAELTGVSYATIAVAAIVPAVAYLCCVAVGIYFHARRFRLTADAVTVGAPDRRAFLSARNIIEFALPVGLLVYLLFVGGRSPALAAGYALCALVAIDLVAALVARQRLGQWGASMLQALVAAGHAVARIGVLVAAVQILASLLTYAGLATRISSELVGLGAGAFFATLLISMVVCTVLGMELPAVGAYVLGAAVVAPALVGLGVPLIAAHMFVLFFSILAAITPPVCTTVFVTASMAEARWLSASGYAVMLGLSAWLIPFVIVYEPGILLGTGIPLAGLSIVTLLLGIVLVAAAGAGWFVRDVGWPVRITLLALGVLAVSPVSWVSAIALGAGGALAVILAHTRAGDQGGQGGPGNDAVPRPMSAA